MFIYHLIIEVVLYKTDFWKVWDGKFIFSMYDSKSVEIDPNEPTIIGIIATFLHFHILVTSIFKSTYFMSLVSRNGNVN